MLWQTDILVLPLLLSALSSFSIRSGATPQERDNCLQTLGFTLHPMIGQPGLYLEIIPAVKPDIVTVMIALAFRSIAVVQHACEIAVVRVNYRQFLLRIMSK